MRYWITEYKKGKNDKQWGVKVETGEKGPLGEKIYIGKGIFDTYQEAVETIHMLRKKERKSS